MLIQARIPTLSDDEMDPWLLSDLVLGGALALLVLVMVLFLYKIKVDRNRSKARIYAERQRLGR